MVRARKRFGQHWLRSEAVLEQIVAAAEVHGGDRLLEIGAGTGVLSRPLVASGAEVVSVEIDRDLYAGLSQTLRAPNFTLLNADALHLDLAPLACTKVVANIPYNITGPLLIHLLGTIARPRQPAFERLVLLVQKEVGDRLIASPGTKAYGALSLRVQHLAGVELICSVPPTAFRPAPKVESAVVRLFPQPPNPNPWLDRLVRQGFSSRRKMLTNALKPIIDPEIVRLGLAQLGVSAQCRGEDLTLEQWIALSDRLQQAAMTL